jgi:hypothetical protein
MLYLSDVPFEQLGFPTELPHTAPPEETEKIMSKLPFVIGGVAAVMTSTAMFTHRGATRSAEGSTTSVQIPSTLPPDGQEE